MEWAPIVLIRFEAVASLKAERASPRFQESKYRALILLVNYSHVTRNTSFNYNHSVVDIHFQKHSKTSDELFKVR